MKKQFTKEFMIKNSGCYSKTQLENCSFMKNKRILLSSILKSEIPLRDKFWFVCNKLASAKENQKIAIFSAWAVLPIYEKSYPNDFRPRKAIQAAKDFIAGKITKEELESATTGAGRAAGAAGAAWAARAARAAGANKKVENKLLNELIKFCITKQKT